MTKKPDWGKGDLIAMPQDLSDEGTIFDGCHVFVAEHEPRLEGTRWLYGLRPCTELRRATVEDVDRLLRIGCERLNREVEFVRRLLKFKAEFFGKERV